MKLTPSIFQFFGIVTLVAIGAVYSRDPGCQEWPLSYFSASTAAHMTLPRVICADWTADGQKLLIRFYGEESCRARLVLHDLAHEGTHTEIDVPGDCVSSAAVAPDGSHVLVGSYEGRLWWIEPGSRATPEPIIKMSRETAFTSMAVAENGLLLAAGTGQGSISLYDLRRESSAILKSPTKSTVGDLRFSRDGRRLVAAQNSGRVSVWDVATGELQQELVGHNGPVAAAAFLPDDKRIISAGGDDTIRIWDVALGRELWRGEFNLGRVTTLDLSRDGTTAAWAGYGQKIVVWDLERGQKKLEIATKVPTRHLKFSPDGKLLATVGLEEIVRLYNVQTAEETTRRL